MKGLLLVDSGRPSGGGPKRKMMLKNDCVKRRRIYMNEEVHQLQASIVCHDLKHVGLVTSAVKVLMEGRELDNMINRIPLGSRESRSASLWVWWARWGLTQAPIPHRSTPSRVTIEKLAWQGDIEEAIEDPDVARWAHFAGQPSLG